MGDSILFSFREACVKTNQNNKSQLAGVCCEDERQAPDFRQVPARSRGTDPNSQMLHYFSNQSFYLSNLKKFTAQHCSDCSRQNVFAPLTETTEDYGRRLSPTRCCDWLFYFLAKVKFGEKRN